MRRQSVLPILLTIVGFALSAAPAWAGNLQSILPLGPAPATPADADAVFGAHRSTVSAGAGLFGACQTGNCAVVNQQGSGNDATITQWDTGNRASIEQVGSYNIHSISQSGTGNLAAIGVWRAGAAQPANSNVGSIVQSGTGNLAAMAIRGNRNNFAIAQQPNLAAGYAVAANNYAAVTVLGSDNQASQTQNGTGNQAEVVLTGSGNNTAQIQTGDGNRMMLVVDGNQNNVALAQAGDFNNMTYVIRANNVQPGDLPVVSQTGGAPGAPPVVVTFSGGSGLVTPQH